MIKVIITGVAGLFGAHFSRYLLDAGYDVVGIDNLSGGYDEYIDDRVAFVNMDLLDSMLLNEIFEAYKPDYVYHFAAYAAEGLSPFIRNFNYMNNVICSINVINNCVNHNVKKLIFTSSMAVYGVGQVPFKEDQIPSPVDPYGIAKFTVEQDLKQAKDQFGLNYNIIRPHNVIGIYQNIWDKYRNVIGIWIRKVLNNENISVYGDGMQKRAFSDIFYYMLPMERMMTGYDNEIFNIGSDKEYTILEVANVIKDIANADGKNVNIEFLDTRHEVKLAYSDQHKIKTMLKFRDNTDLKKTISEMYEWAKKQPDRDVKVMPYEINKNIYTYWK
jgi:UDP-glucose 4-epimerase